MTFLPQFLFVFETVHSPSVSKLLLREAIETGSLCSSEDIHLSPASIYFPVQQESILFVNSFLPAVSVKFLEVGSCTRIEASFTLKPTIRAIIYALTSILATFEIILLLFFLSGKLSSPLLLFLPLLLVFWVQLLSRLGLKISSKSVISLISSALK